MAVLGLRFCARAFSSCGKRGPLFIVVRGPHTTAASLVAEHRLQTRRLSNCGSRAQLLRSMWDLPRPGLEPVSPALAGGFSTTAPPGKPWHHLLISTWGMLVTSIIKVDHWKLKQMTFLERRKLGLWKRELEPNEKVNTWGWWRSSGYPFFHLMYFHPVVMFPHERFLINCVSLRLSFLLFKHHVTSI